MSFCQSCGTQITSEAAFCAKCGAPSSNSQNTSLPVTAITDQSLPTQINDSDTNKEALKLANQVVLAFIWMLLCDFKGADGKNVFNDIGIYILIYTVLMAITYFCVVVKGIKENKTNFVMITTILLTLLYVVSLVGSDQSNNNFFDWLNIIVGFIQVGLLYRVYTLLKSSV